MKEPGLMTAAEVKETVDKELDLRLERPVKFSIGQLVSIFGAFGALLIVVILAWASITNMQEDHKKQLESLAAIPEKLNDMDRRLYALELQGKIASVTNTGQGGTVNMNTENERRELKEKPELKTSELARLLGVTSETITNNIKKDSTGEPIHFEFLSKQYEVRRSGNTFVIENPQYEP